MSFNFTQEDLNKAEEKQIFNGGKAGRVKDVKVSMQEAGVDYQKSNENAPDFKVFFEDTEGYKTNRACFSIKESDYPNQFGTTYEQAMKKEWAFLNKIVEHTGGTKVMSFSDDVDLFTKVKASLGTGLVNVFANYGSNRSPKSFIEVRKWMPAVEPADTADADTKLKASGLDQMAELVPDAKAEGEVDNTFFG